MLPRKYIYKQIIEKKPWLEMEKHFDNLPVKTVEPLTQLKIDNTDDWIKFTVDNFDLAEQRWETPRPKTERFKDTDKKWANINIQMGRNEHNTFELNYGVNGDTNEKLKELLGDDNMQKLNAIPSTVLIRLMVKMPGHGVAWHTDEGGRYGSLFPDVDKSKIKRFWFSIEDWKDGHAFQISKTVLSNWKKGEVFHLPFNTGHASSNFGYAPQYTVSFTTVIKD